MPEPHTTIEHLQSYEMERAETDLKMQESQKILQSPNPDFSGTNKSLGGTIKHMKAKANIIEKEEPEH